MKFATLNSEEKRLSLFISKLKERRRLLRVKYLDLDVRVVALESKLDAMVFSRTGLLRRSKVRKNKKNGDLND